MSVSSLREHYAPHSICYGCGPANTDGLHVRSFVDGDLVVAEWTPSAHHEAFPGMLNGGIIGTLLDCHCNWTAAHHLMQRDQLAHPPCTVTAEYTIRMRKPTPSGGSVRLRAWVAESKGRVTATCRGLFVAVEPGHPAYHRW
jgi:acyl-coenzyme A thioesterase PaaI-like protein